MTDIELQAQITVVSARIEAGEAGLGAELLELLREVLARAGRSGGADGLHPNWKWEAEADGPGAGAWTAFMEAPRWADCGAMSAYHLPDSDLFVWWLAARGGADVGRTKMLRDAMREAQAAYERFLERTQCTVSATTDPKS